jgi:integrase
MASILKIKSTRKLPGNADIVTRKGKKFLRKKRGGRIVLLPVTECGTKYRDESTNWYIQYKDANGIRQRAPGYTDKEATLQLAAKLERKAEQIQSGLTDPHEEGKLKLLKDHLKDFKGSLRSKADSEQHVTQTCFRVERIIDGCKFVRWIDIVSSKVINWLAAEREAETMGIKTSNYYLAAFKQFCTWLEVDGRVPKAKNPVEHLSSINASADVRRERRAITTEEFTRLVEATSSGPDIQCISGPDRAMLYVLAAWTGYRRSELASLTLKSFNFESDPPSVQVKAGYSKRRRNDIVPLHPVVAEQLKSWLEAKGEIEQSGSIFNLKTKSGGIRRTSKIMQRDLERARAAWIKEAKSDKERKKREESDFLKYQDENGMYADFHAHRHLFITNLAKAGVHPKVAQSIARHSDVNLTMNIYSHVEVEQQASAINTLPAPPSMEGNANKEEVAAEADDVNDESDAESQEEHTGVSESVAPVVAQTSDFDCLCPTLPDIDCPLSHSSVTAQNPLPQKELVVLCQALTSDDANTPGRTRTCNLRIRSQ